MHLKIVNKIFVHLVCLFVCDLVFVCDRCGNNYRAAQSLSPTRAAEANIGICIQNKGLSRTTHTKNNMMVMILMVMMTMRKTKTMTTMMMMMAMMTMMMMMMMTMMTTMMMAGTFHRLLASRVPDRNISASWNNQGEIQLILKMMMTVAPAMMMI